jgi:hypothetical protein
MAHHPGDDVGQVDEPDGQQDALDHRVAAPDDDQPDRQRDQRHGCVLGHVEQLEGGGDAGELGHRGHRIGDQEQQHREGGAPDAEALPDQVGQPLARHDGHAGAHLVDHRQADGDQGEDPEHLVAELGACLGVGGDRAGVVAGVRGDQPRADDRQQDEEAPEAAETRGQPAHRALSAPWAACA